MLNIKRGNKSDIDFLANIEAKCFPASEAASKSRIAERMNVFSNHFYVAEENGQIVGFVNGLVSDERTISDEMFDNAMLHDEKGKYQMIFGLSVLAEYRKKGIASKLMQAIINAAKEEGREGVVLTCKHELIPFYEKLGFENRGVSKSVYGGVVWYDMELIC